jgi:hypothetical protein
MTGGEHKIIKVLHGLLYTVPIAVAMSGLGIILDSFLLPRQKSKLRDRLSEWWVHLVDARIPDLGTFVVVRFFIVVNALFGKKILTTRNIILICAASSAVTSFAILLGDYRSWLAYHGSEDWVSFDYLMWRAFQSFPANRPQYIIPINIALDTTTIWITVLLLKRFLDITNWLLRLFIIVADIAIASLLACLCFYVAIQFQKTVLPRAVVSDADLTPLGYFKYLYFYAATIFEWLPYPFDMNDPKQFGEMLIFGTDAGFLYVAVLYASTTLVPTAIYLIIAAAALSFSIIGKVIVAFCSHVLQLSVDTEKSIFFYTGQIFGVAAIFGKLVVDLAKS